MTNVLLGDTEPGIEVHRKESDNWSWCNCGQAVTEDERPYPAFPEIGEGELGGFVLDLWKKRRPRDGYPENEPRESKRSRNDECRAPSIGERKRHCDQRSS